MNRSFPIVVILALLVLAVSLTAFTVNEAEYAVKFKLGRIVKTDYQPGLHFKLPFVNNVRKFDKRIMTLDIPPKDVNTSEKKYVKVDSFVEWRITDVANYYTATQGDVLRAAARLQTIIQGDIQDEFAKNTLKEVVNDKRAEIMDTLTTNASDQAAEFGIEVVDVRIKRIELSDSVLRSVYARMQTERKEVANELRSEGREEAERITSNADRQAQIILAEANRDSELLKGEGDAGAADLYAQAYTADAEFYSFYRSLDAYRKAFKGNGDVLVLDPSSDFFDYFDTDQGN